MRKVPETLKELILFGALSAYIALLSLISVIVAVYDKAASKKLPKHRISERTLVLLALLGGGPGMLIALLAVRHKTKHPAIITAAALSAVFWGVVFAASAVMFAFEYSVMI